MDVRMIRRIAGARAASRLSLTAAALLCALALAAPRLAAQASGEDLDRYLDQMFGGRGRPAPEAGSIFVDHGSLAELGRDPKAAQVGDLVTILVVEQANALSTGSTSTSRETTSDRSITSLFGPLNPAGTLPNLNSLEGERTLEGEGSTQRTTSVTTTMTARVTHVLPNGNLVIRAVREIIVNSERQTVSLRGVVRPIDLTFDNTVTSDRVALAEVKVDGKGVVNDAIRRPNVLVRILRRILPF